MFAAVDLPKEIPPRVAEELPPRVVEVVNWGLSHPYPAGAIVVVALVAGVAAWAQIEGWYRERFGPDAIKVIRRWVTILAAALWLGMARPKKKAPRDHTWPVLNRNYPAEFLVMLSGSGSGKTTRVLLPAAVRRLKEGIYSLVFLDNKGEILVSIGVFLARFAGFPRVGVISTMPSDPDKRVTAVDVFADRESAEQFISSVYASREEKEAVWGEGAKEMLLNVREALGGADLPTTVEAIRDNQAMDRLAEEYPELVGSSWPGSNVRGSHHEIRTNILGPFGGLKNPRFRRLFERGRATDLKSFFSRREVIFLRYRAEDRKAAAPLFSGVNGLLQTRAANREEGPPVEFWVDEAGTAYPLRLVEDFIQMCRGEGVNMALFFQNLDQIYSKIGRDAGNNLIGAADLLIIGPTRSPSTQELAESQSGTVRVIRKRRGSDGKTHPEEEPRPRVRKENVRTLKNGQFLVYLLPRESPELVRHRPKFPQYRDFFLPKKEDRRGIRFNLPPKKKREGELPQPEPSPPEAEEIGQKGAGDSGTTPVVVRCPDCGAGNPGDLERCFECGGTLL